jgi:RimJ/RimL family protein N-acetyltransferase
VEADSNLVQQAPPFLQQGRLFGGARRLLHDGVFAGAIDSGNWLRPRTATLTDEYAEIGVGTLARYRQQGIAAATASLICREVQLMGRVPVWNCAEDNQPSRHLAEKLGFVSIGRRMDLIPAQDTALSLGSG